MLRSSLCATHAFGANFETHDAMWSPACQMASSRSRRVGLLCLLPSLLRAGRCRAFAPRQRQRLTTRHQGLTGRVPGIGDAIVTPQFKRERIKVRQLGGGCGDYLNSLSPDQEQDNAAAAGGTGGINDDPAAAPGNPPLPSRGIDISKSAFQNAASGIKNEVVSLSDEVGKLTLMDLAAGVASAGSGFQSFARDAKRRTDVMGKRQMRDLKRTSRAIGQSVGKGLTDMYPFGGVDANEVARWINDQAKSGAEKVKSTAKSSVLNYTGKNSYRFGDVSRELARRIAASDISWSDALLLLKILLALGALVGPLAELLPFTFLVQALNISVEERVGGTVIGLLTRAVDNRLVASLFSEDDKSLIGDVAKRTVLEGVLRFTGKDEYKPGDIERTVTVQGERGDRSKKLDLEITSEFADWDTKFIEQTETEEYFEDQARELDTKIAMALNECEALSRRNYGQ